MKIRVVLVDTTHPGNVGAVARAMKNMDIRDLVLVRPKVFPSSEATARASGADDVLKQARVVETLDEALKECAWVVGTTSRQRMHHCTVMDVREAAQKIVGIAANETVAVVFGSERVGLTNEEILRCNALIRIPANPEYESLNLAMAVQIVCYELFMARGATVVKPEREMPLASAQEMQRLYAHLEEVLQEVEFVDRTPGGDNLLGRFRRLFNRAELDKNEANILRGLFTAIQRKRRVAGTPAAGRGGVD